VAVIGCLTPFCSARWLPVSVDMASNEVSMSLDKIAVITNIKLPMSNYEDKIAVINY
jgi:hypothetical protein